MTYKSLVDRIEDAVSRHKMLVDFGYGQLSDIKVLDNSEDGADYPYAFLLPTGITRAQQAVTYSFSLIVMEMAITPREILKVQSDCIQYINDLVADLRFDTTFDGDVNLTQSVQVFRERFQDEVAGATLNLQVTVADQIDQCISPVLPASDLLVHATNSNDGTLGPDPGDDSVLAYNTDIVNNGQWVLNKYVINKTARYKFVVNQQVVFNPLAPGESYPTEFVLREITSFTERQPTFSNWPDTIVAGETYSLKMEWEYDIEDQAGTQWEFFFLRDQPGEEGTLVQKAGGSVKIYEIN